MNTIKSFSYGRRYLGTSIRFLSGEEEGLVRSGTVIGIEYDLETEMVIWTIDTLAGVLHYTQDYMLGQGVWMGEGQALESVAYE